ncbi:thiol:disulfide interchange protein DsbA/DsbL [Thalassotalea euphylliae]|uniref:thiol:disulfide interchange protein DsbA/DsbL n=1 Tax=Thalassotalea euphylliae TaxID=1655234 RepID=UPI0036307DED
MKNILMAITLTISAIPVFASEFIEGKHYQVLANPISDKQEVREYFSFYCPHCFKQEPFMNEVAATLPQGVAFNKNHVDSMPGQQPDIEHALTKAIITADRLGEKDKIVGAIFKYIHVDRATFDKESDIRNLFLVNGIDNEKFDKVFNSFSVNALANKMKKNTEQLRAQGVRTVPTLIVNGKYRPLTNDIKSIAQYKALIQHLLEKKA